MCGTADSLKFTQYVWFNRLLNAQTLCAVQQRVKLSLNIFGTADSLMLPLYVGTSDSLMITKYVLYSRQFNAHIIYTVQQTVQCSHHMCGTADILILTQYV